MLYMSMQRQTGILNIAQGAGSGAMASGIETAQKIGTVQKKQEFMGKSITKQHQEEEQSQETRKIGSSQTKQRFRLKGHRYTHWRGKTEN